MFSKFLARYANEMRDIGSARDVLQHAGALPPQDRERIAATIENIKVVAENVEKAVATVIDTINRVQIDDKKLQADVNEVLLSFVATAVAKALAEAQKPKRNRR
jgi:DNA-binding protein YbaB